MNITWNNVIYSIITYVGIKKEVKLWNKPILNLTVYFNLGFIITIFRLVFIAIKKYFQLGLSQKHKKTFSNAALGNHPYDHI